MILGPFWEQFEHPLASKIAQNGAGLIRGGGPWNRLRAKGAQGYPLAPKMDAKGHPKTLKWSPKDAKGHPKTPKWSPKAPPRAPKLYLFATPESPKRD